MISLIRGLGLGSPVADFGPLPFQAEGGMETGDTAFLLDERGNDVTAEVFGAGIRG